MAGSVSLKSADYIVAMIILLVPVAIGIIFAVKDAKRTTRLEYLLGGQRMTMLPVTLSMFATYQSAISLIGIPSEVYIYGTGVFFYFIGFCISYIVCYFTVIPLMYPLEVTSIYEYLSLRFRSQAVRLLSTVIMCLQTIFFMAIALLAPALALQAASDLPLWITVLLIGIVGTVYTVIGGIKSVIWTDAFQCTIMFIGIFAMIIKGSMAVGGFTKAWEMADDGGRLLFDKYQLDPRVRLTWAGTLLGGFSAWLSTTFTQSSLQRIRSMKSLSDAKLSYVVIIPILLVYGLLLNIIGVISYAYFTFIRCDPLKGHLIHNPSQVSPFFVFHVMDDLPGMSGLYVSTLLCGTLSTFSSGINSLAANTVEDFLERPLRNVSERTATTVTKIAAAFYGVSVSLLSYTAQYLHGPVTQIVASVVAPLNTITMGMFLIGCIAPWGNKYGALAGGITSFAFTLWLILGAMFNSRRPTPLAPAPVDNCEKFSSNGNVSDARSPLHIFNSTTLSYNVDLYSRPTLSPPQGHEAADITSYPFSFYDISYEWYSVVALVITLGVGLAVSYATKSKCEKLSRADSKLLFSVCRRFLSFDNPENIDNLEMHGLNCKEKAVAA